MAHKTKKRQSMGVKSGILGIVCNAALFVLKIILGKAANSISIIADGFNNLSDAGSSLVTLVGFKLSGKAADEKHPYGYGRAEYLSGLVVAFLILLTGFEMGKASFGRLFHPQEMTGNLWIIVGLISSILLKIVLWAYNHYMAKKIGSAALRGAAIDSLSDVFATGITLLALILSPYTNLPLDGFMGMIVAAFILFSGWSVMKDTISPLLGEGVDPKLVQKIKGILLSYDGILDVHELEVHDYGPNKRLASVHVEVPAGTNLVVAHEIIDRAEEQIEKELFIETVIHLDPVQTEDEEVKKMRQKVQEIVCTLNPGFVVYTFRMTDDALIFELSVPTKTRETDEEIQNAIKKEISAIAPGYETVIHLDRTCY